MKKILSLACAVLIGASLYAAAPAASDFALFCDSLTVRTSARMGVESTVKLSKVLRRSRTLDFYFTSDLGDFPWRKADISWFKSALKDSIPAGYELGQIFVRNVRFEEHAVTLPGNGGKASGASFSHDPANSSPTVRGTSSRTFRKGLHGRHIALWQSHGRYYDSKTDSWLWQRAPLHTTVEDIFTRSFVLKYLIPMLENAGANVFTPRERDVQPLEYVIDNDPAFDGPREGLLRRTGSYREAGTWSNAGVGFADAKQVYDLSDNPFTMGTARSAACNEKGKSSAVWTAKVGERGRYAVYVSYLSQFNSSKSALYTVSHLGGTTSFEVDQTRGGGMWIYLGTFEFGPGQDAVVTLSNKGKTGSCVCADAVRIGGGMGKVRRGEAGLSGLPAAAEGALYSMPWYGVDSKITSEWDNDYTNDFADRGPWTRMIKDEKGIPVDLSFAFHTDAGVTPGDSIVGTLSIYTLFADGKRKNSDGTDRSVCRVLADYVQSQVCSDLREGFDSTWTRRQLWNRSYSEARTTDVPGMLLELLSHQNFADMRLGLDPSFQFAACRAVYKGMLKFLSELYDVDYAVQPLPVEDFAVRLKSGGKASLSWTPREDPLEPTASAKGYRVYTRIDDGAFDNGRDVNSSHMDVDIKPGHVYSFKVAAWNDGGFSFPSEILSAGVPSSSVTPREVLIVNNFTRVSAPSWIDSERFAGFDGREDGGVPYIDDISYLGEVYDFRRNSEWLSDDAPGCGASRTDNAGKTVAGNTFDYPSVHGRALLDLGFSFSSMSASAFAQSPSAAYALDLVCGKQVTTMTGKNEVRTRFEVFPESLQAAIRAFAAAGGNLIVSGADIVTDSRSEVYPAQFNPERRSACRAFISEVLGCKYVSGHAGVEGTVQGMPFYNEMNAECYCVENPDSVGPDAKTAEAVLFYDGTLLPAAVHYDAGAYRAATFGFPLETLKSSADLRSVLSSALSFFAE